MLPSHDESLFQSALTLTRSRAVADPLASPGGRGDQRVAAAGGEPGTDPLSCPADVAIMPAFIGVPPSTDDPQGSRMHTDFFAWLEQHHGRQYDLHSRAHQPAFVKMLRTIGFDKGYVRGEGPLPLGRRGQQVPRPAHRLGRLRAGPQPPEGQGDPPATDRPRPAQPRPHGLRPAQRAGRRRS